MDSPSTPARPHPQASPRWLAVANVIFAGIAAGLLVRRWGDRRLLTGGLAILGGASLLGASMQDFAWLLATRFVEGCWR